MKHNPETRTVTNINGVDVVVFTLDDNSTVIPIKPICEALGVDLIFQGRIIKENQVLSSVLTQVDVTDSNDKTDILLCIPLRYVFGWLFIISLEDVSPDAHQRVKKSIQMCYEALFSDLELKIEFLEQKQKALDSVLDEIQNSLNSLSFDADLPDLLLDPDLTDTN